MLRRNIVIFLLSILSFAVSVEARDVKVSFYPYGRIHEVAVDGTHSGFGYEVLELLASKGGWTNVYVGHDLAWSDAEKMIQTGELDILDCVRRLPGREERYEFSAQPAGFSFGCMLVRVDETRFVPREYASWGRIKVSAMANEAVGEEIIEYASTNGIELNVIAYPTAEAALEALRSGAVDMSVVESTADCTGFKVLESFNPKPYYFCTKKGNRALMDEIDHAMSEVYNENPGWYLEVCRKYYPQEDVIVYMPRAYENEDGMRRYLQAMADLLAAISGWNPIFKTCSDDFSDADFSVPCIAAHVLRTPENLAKFDFPFVPVCRQPVCLSAKPKDERFKNGISRDTTVKVGYCQKEPVWLKCFLNYAQNHNIAYTLVPFATTEEVRKATLAGTVDLAMLGRDTRTDLVRIEDCGNVDFDFATPKSQSALQHTLDMAVRYMRYHEGAFIRRIERYAYGMEDTSRVVRAGIYVETGAIELAQDGSVSGYLAEYLSEVAKIAGWDLVYVPMTHNEAFAALAAGEVDIVGMSTPYPEPSELWNVSHRDAGVVRYALKVKMDSNLQPNHPELWTGNRIGYLSGSRPVTELKNYLDSIGAKYQLVPYNSIQNARRDVDNGRLDGIFTVHARESKDYRTIAVFPQIHILFCTNRNRPDLKKALDEAMDSFAALNMDFNWWLNNQFLKTTGELLTLEANEIRFVEQNRDRTFVICCPRNLVPLATYDKKTGKASGFLHSLFCLIEQQLGLRFKYVNSGKADVYVIDREVNELESGLIMMPDWFPLPTVRVSLPEDSIPETARGIWAVEATRKGEIEYLQRKNLKVLLVDSKEECYRAVVDGRAEATIDNMGTARLLIDENRAYRKLRDYRIDSKEWARQVTIAFPSDGSPELRRLFKKARTAISGSTSEKLFIDAVIAARHGRYTTEDIVLYGSIAGVLLVLLIVALKVSADRKQREHLQQSLLFTNYFVDTFISAYYIDLKTHSFKIYKRPPELAKGVWELPDYIESIGEYVARYVHPDDRQALLDFIQPENLKTRLADKPTAILTFRTLAEDGEKVLRLRAVRGGDENSIAFAFSDETDEVVKEQQWTHRIEVTERVNQLLTVANRHEKFRADALDFILKNENLEKFIEFLSARILDLYGCDQVIYRDVENRMIIKEKFGTPQLDFSLCANCPHYAFDSEVYKDGYTLMDDCAIGYNGIPVHKDCRVRASLTWLVHEDDRTFGYIALHYLDTTHHFTEDERTTFNSIAQLLSLVVTRRKHRTIEREHAKRLEISNHHERLKAEAFEFVLRNEDFDHFIEFFAERVIDLYGCDHVLYRDNDGRQVLKERPGAPAISFAQCPDCPHHDFTHPLYSDGYTVMEDCRVGAKGIPVHPACPVRSALTYVVYEDGKPFGYIAIHYLNQTHHFTDEEKSTFDRVSKFLSLVISRRKHHREVVEARLSAENANRAKTEFLFNMSHDIRTPMNAILGFTGMAEKHLDDKEKVRDCLVKTQQSGNLLLALINSVLNMSRIEAGNAELQENPENVYYSFSNIESALQEIAASRDVKLSFEFGEITDCYVLVDSQRCIRIFTNLISNAIKYSHVGGYVKVRCEQSSPMKDDGYAVYRYTIEDNGIGMSEEFQKHMFEAFTREQNSTTSGIQGTGLGLSVCKTFVEYMNGTIDCVSKLGVGTTFTVTLPFKVQTEQNYTDPITGEVKSGNEPSVPNVEIDFTGKRVLLVEDNELNREIAIELLADEGLIVEEAKDGSNAVELLKKKGADFYDFILMDIQMPVMNGYEATKAIRAMYPEAKLPIIALSANAFAEDKAASLAAGMNDHVAKPVKIKELVTAMAKFL